MKAAISPQEALNQQCRIFQKVAVKLRVTFSHNSSDLLAQFLLEKGTHTKSVHGEYDFDDWENKFPHTWLETDGGVIIDITADQFVGEKVFEEFSLQPCYVGADREFYSLFQENHREEVFRGLRNCGGEFYRRNVDPLYMVILSYIF